MIAIYGPEEDCIRYSSEKIGMSCELVALYFNQGLAGKAYLNLYDGDTWYIEWIEIVKSHQGQHLFRSFIRELMESLSVTKLTFAASHAKLPMYEHLGAVQTTEESYSPDMTMCEISRDALDKTAA